MAMTTSHQRSILKMKKPLEQAEREIDCLQVNCTFKFKITPDRHNAGQKLKYCVHPDPPHFSLPSTFKQSTGYVTFWYGSGFADPCYWSGSCSYLQDAIKK
jgi:hypothetical protein